MWKIPLRSTRLSENRTNWFVENARRVTTNCHFKTSTPLLQRTLTSSAHFTSRFHSCSFFCAPHKSLPHFLTSDRTYQSFKFKNAFKSRIFFSSMTNPSSTWKTGVLSLSSFFAFAAMLFTLGTMSSNAEEESKSDKSDTNAHFSNSNMILPNYALKLSGYAEYDVIPADEEADILVVLTVDAPKTPENYRTNVSVFLDCDISEKTTWLEKEAGLKSGLKLLLNHLTPKDWAMLYQMKSSFFFENSAFDDNWIKLDERSKDHLLILIDKQLSVSDQGAIFNSFFKAAELMHSPKTETSIRSCFLITEGFSNAFKGINYEGVKNTIETKMRAEKNTKIKDENVFTNLSGNTFGYGEHHNPAVLAVMAGHADGIYYYVPTAEQLRSALGDCLAGLISTVAYNIFIQIEGDVKVKYPILPFQRIYNTNKLHIGNIQSQETKDIIVRVTVPKTKQKESQIRLTLSYQNIPANKYEYIHTSFNISRDGSAKKPNYYVDVHKNRAHVAKAFFKALVYILNDQQEVAENLLREAKNYVQSSLSKDHHLSQVLLKDLELVSSLFQQDPYQTCKTLGQLVSMHFSQRSVAREHNNPYDTDLKKVYRRLFQNTV